jgi:hypothetical protein
MSDAQQNAYAEDLYRRTIVPMVLANVQEHQANLLKNLRAAHDSVDTDSWQYFVLKFMASNLAAVGFPGTGHALVDGFTTSLEVYLNGRKADAAWRAFMAVPAILKGSAESSASIYSNTINGYQRILSQLPSRPITGKVTNVQQFSQGEYWGFVYWKEDASYTEFDLTNTSGERVDFDILVEYGYDSELFGLPWAFIPLVKSEKANLAPNETKRVRLYFKQEENGGSPKQNSRARIDVLATNNTGTFFIDSDDRSWNPQRITPAGTVIAANEMAADASVIENPIDMYVLGDPYQQSYEAQIWISNPFSQPITVLVNQPLIIDMVASSTLGDTKDSTIQWTQTIQPRDIISLSFQFRQGGIPGETLSLPPATMSFVEPTSGVALTTHSNSPSFTIQSPIKLNAYTPPHVSGNDSTLPVTVTNYLDRVVDGSVIVEILDTNTNKLSGETKLFTVGAKGNQVLPFKLPASLPPGVYDLQFWLVMSGIQNLVMHDTLLVKGFLGLSGDCNGDRAVGASDVTALALEFFDGDDNNSPQSAGGGSYPGNAGCDANQDTRIGASDITCIARIFFYGAGSCSVTARTAAADAPVLSIPDQLPAAANGQVTVPLVLQTNNRDVSSLLFALDYDEAWLSLNPTDSNQDGIPDAIRFNLPAQYVRSVSLDTKAGKLDIMLANFAATPLALPNGALLTITFAVGEAPAQTAASLKFSQEPTPSWGGASGETLAGSVYNGSVLITPQEQSARPAIYLPLVSQNH